MSSKNSLRGHLKKTNVELKGIRQNFRDLDIRLPPIEGKLSGFEACVGQLQGDVLVIKHTVTSTEENPAAVALSLKELDKDLGDKVKSSDLEVL